MGVLGDGMRVAVECVKRGDLWPGLMADVRSAYRWQESEPP